MYAVIFRAGVAGPDNEYSEMAERLRRLAKDRYGCREFTSATEGGREVAISYWDSEEQIQAWKNDPEHVLAQELGKSKWYEWYEVQVVRILRQYGESA